MMRTKAEKLETVTVKGREIQIDNSGFLFDSDLWNEDVARFLAEREGLELTDEHWQIIRYMRAFLEEHGVSPDARFVFSYLGEVQGCSAREARKHFFELFPYGYVKQACKIAGLRQPRAWSTG